MDNERRQEVIAMEEFLIEYWDKYSMSHTFLPTDFLKKHLQEYPLDEERYEKIVAFLKERVHFDMFCAKYGIGTEKIDYKQYAEKHDLSEKKVKNSFTHSPSLLKDSAVKLCYLAIKPEILRRIVCDAQFELHNAMLAYDSLTGKNTAYEHHVGIVDGPNQGMTLFNMGYDTLEEIQKADRKFLENDSTGVRNSIAVEVSETLNRYGLQNTLWRGALKRVSGNPFDKENPPIYIKEDFDEVKFIFKPMKFTLNQEEILATIDDMIFANHCTGADSKRLSHGDIRVYFNPTCHDASDRRYVVKKVDEAIRKPCADSVF